MKSLVTFLGKYIYIILVFFLTITLTSCSITDDSSESLTQESQTETSASEEGNESRTEPSFEDYESYMGYISDKSNFQPYYKTVFAFEEVPGGMDNVPIQKLKVMYEEMKEVFDYVLISEYPLYYRGYYEGDLRFVDGYEQDQTSNENLDISTLINVTGYDFEGNETIITPLKTVLLGEGIFSRFSNSIAEGRNLQTTDFKLASPDQPISVVLGNAYKDIYKIGDTFSLELISEVMNFQVVGFYKPGVNFSMETGALHNVDFDYTIVMPHFIPDYEPNGDSAFFQHAFHIAELTSGYIAISEPVQQIKDDTYEDIIITMEEMAKRNGLDNFYKIPYWPVGFVWNDE